MLKLRFASPWLLTGAVAVLAGCGGGAGVQSTPLALQGAAERSSTPAPWPSAGASFVYTGTFVQTTTGGSKSTLDVTQRVRTSAGTFKGRAVTVYSGVETETGAGAASATFDAYVAQSPSSTRKGSDVELAKAESDSGDIAQTTVYDAGNGVFDQLPEVPQARWTNTAARTVSIIDSYAGSSVHDTYRADGTYGEKAVPVEGLQALAQSFPDANALYQWPLQGGTMNSTITYSPPTGHSLQVLLVNASAHVTELIQFGAWYPTAPPVFASDSFRDAGSVQIPSACGVPKRYGRNATEITEQMTRLDIIFGEYETTQRTAYVEAPYGLVCLDVNDELQTYYNYTALALSSKPLTVTTTDETLGLQQAHVPKASVAEGSAALPLDARVAVWRDALRLKTARAIFYSLRHVRNRK